MESDGCGQDGHSSPKHWTAPRGLRVWPWACQLGGGFGTVREGSSLSIRLLHTLNIVMRLVSVASSKLASLLGSATGREVERWGAGEGSSEKMSANPCQKDLNQDLGGRERGRKEGLLMASFAPRLHSTAFFFAAQYCTLNDKSWAGGRPGNEAN